MTDQAVCQTGLSLWLNGGKQQNMAGKEGESYLDQLLNNASKSPQAAGLEKVKENNYKADIDKVGLDEALAVLSDLPDGSGIPSNSDPKE